MRKVTMAVATVVLVIAVGLVSVAPAGTQYMLVGRTGSNQVDSFDPATRALIGTVATVPKNLQQIAVGPDGNLYIQTAGGGEPPNDAVVYRYALDGTPLPGPGKSGAEFINAYDDIKDSIYAELGKGLAPGPDGLLYLTGQNHCNGIHRFNPATGAGETFLFTTDYTKGIAFGPDANADGVADLYAAWANGVHVLDPVTLSPIDIDGAGPKAAGEFVSDGAAGLTNAANLCFSGGRLYVNNAGDGWPYVFDAATGEPIDIDGAGGNPLGVFNDDKTYNKADAMAAGFDGYLYMGERWSNRMHYFDQADGSLVGSMTVGGALQPVFHEESDDGPEVPEPASAALFALGMVAVAAWRRRTSRARA